MRGKAVVLLTVLVLAGCSAEAAPDPAPTAAASSTATQSASAPATDFEAELRARIQPPAMPSFTIPADLAGSAQEDEIARSLELNPGLYQGIAVLGARCDADGGLHSADVGAASSNAAGSYKEGGVSVTVKGDGTGVYNAPGLHVAVLGNGSGVYEDGERRLTVDANGGGTWTHGTRRLTVRADGSGSYSDATSRLWVEPTGAGGYRDEQLRITVPAAGDPSGDGSAEQLRAVGEVVREGLPTFPPVPAVKRVKPTGTACGTVIRLDANALFDFGSADLRPDARALVTRVGTLLATVKPPAVEVFGHTDGIGSTAANEDLSTRRATAVGDELARLGIPPGSIQVRGLGESDPVARETTAAGADDPAARQLNRRVEIVLPTR